MKRIKETYLLLLIVFGLISLSLYSTYALFTASTEITDVVNFNATLTTNSNLLEYEMVTVPAGEIKIIEVNVSNSYESILYYGAWYEILSPSDTENIRIGLYTDRNNTSGSWQIATNTTLNLLVGIANDGEEDAIVNIGTVGSLTSNLGLSESRTLLPSGWREVLEIVDPSGANSPELTDGLIPVMYDTTTSKWVTADVTSSTSTYGWYNYAQKKWANAVLVNGTKRASLTKDASGNYTPGQAIGDTESEGVLAFYVWIPRYKYKVWNINKVAGTATYDAKTTGIDIVFEEGTDTTGGITCSYSYASPSTSAGNPNEVCSDSRTEGYYTHPAFTFGNDELTGFWMGKFELSSNSPDSTQGGGSSIELTSRILPNVISWRNNNLTNFWLVIKNMQNANNEYGLITNTSVVDTHMSTNMEWGAAAYLTHSQYGRCTGGETSTCTEVTINNSSSYITGNAGNSISAKQASGTTNTYTTSGGQLASTTGNIYGVYDMSGGAYEYVMGNVPNLSLGTFTYYANNAGSNYTYSGNEKYLTPYAWGASYFDQTAYNRGRLGDATSEIVNEINKGSAWYLDFNYFPVSTFPWFCRGGCFDEDIQAGVFNFDGGNGDMDIYTGVRASLAVFPE